MINWYNFKFRIPFTVRHKLDKNNIEFGKTEFLKIVGIQIGSWFIGAVNGKWYPNSLTDSEKQEAEELYKEAYEDIANGKPWG